MVLGLLLALLIPVGIGFVVSMGVAAFAVGLWHLIAILVVKAVLVLLAVVTRNRIIIIAAFGIITGLWVPYVLGLLPPIL